MKGVNKIIPVDSALANSVKNSYLAGKSIPEVAVEFDISKSTIRAALIEANCIRSRSEAIKLTAAQGKLGSGMRGKKRVFTEAHKQKMKIAAIERGKTSKGFSIKPRGYAEITRGEHKGRLQHRVVAEQKIGRKLLPNEVVHHINHQRSDNRPENLEVMTWTAHASLHALHNLPNRSRDTAGRFL